MTHSTLELTNNDATNDRMCTLRLLVTRNMCNFDIATTKLSNKLANIIAHNVSKLAAEGSVTSKTEARNHQ